MSLPGELYASVLRHGLFLAQAGEPAVPLTPFQHFLSSPFTLLGGLMALFYVLMIVPERRRKAEDAKRLASIKKNDRIVTTGGIHGVVASLGDADTIMIRLDESGSAKMKIDRRSVARIVAEPSDSIAEKQ